MADDDRPALTRRRMIGYSAATAGFVWSRPVVRSVVSGGTTGTPVPPTSSSSTPPQTKTYAFSGSSSGSREFGSRPECPNGVELQTFDVTPPELGATTVQLDVCVGDRVEQTEDHLIRSLTGTFTLQTTGGTVTGSMTGTVFFLTGPPLPPPAEYREDVAISGGTGAFAGAIGSAKLFAFQNGSTFDAFIEWSFEVPI